MKKLEEMNLVDDFLMNSLISHKIYGEKASRYLLECILSKKIGKLMVVPQRPDIPYEDGATTLFLYTKGTQGNPPKMLQNLLRYMEDSTLENAFNEDLLALHRMVTEVKHDREVGSAYMKSFEIEQRVRAEGRAEGRAEEQVNTERERAKAEREKKRADALQQRVSELEGKAEENADILLENVRSIMANLQLPLEQAMTALNMKEEDKAIVREKLK